MKHEIDMKKSIELIKEKVRYDNIKKELIECKRDSEDKRVVHLYLTDKADEVSKVLQLEIEKINTEILDDIPEERIKIMEETMIDIANAFKSKNDESEFK